MRTIWSFRRVHATRYILVLEEHGCVGQTNILYMSGYESTKIRDILEAIWYLKSGFKGHLNEKHIRILEQIKKEVTNDYGEGIS